MATYAIGDIQGCFAPFQQLLRKIGFDPGKDNLWLTGDLVNRGPESLEVLRWVYAHQDCVQTVLGNHDLHLLAVSEGFGKIRSDDTLMAVLNAADGKVLIDWLRCQPMMIAGDGYAMVHAGLMPDWTIDRALGLAEEVENGLSGPGAKTSEARSAFA
jgi:bis(5'-nucleosyl)-tetraphosphatase (symmetrical)